MKNADVTNINPFPDKVEINLDMLCALMLDQVGRQVNSTDVVTVHQGRLGEWAMELKKKLSKPRTLSNSVCNSPILSLSTGTRDSRLSLRRPGDQVTTKEDSKTGCRLASIRTPCPISICVNYQLKRRGWTKEETMVDCTLQVAQDPFDSRKMRLTRGVHVKADLLNSIGDVRTSEGEVLQGTNQTAVMSRIGKKITIGSGQLGVCINWCAAWLAIRHTSALQNIQGILPLREK